MMLQSAVNYSLDEGHSSLKDVSNISICDQQQSFFVATSTNKLTSSPSKEVASKAKHE